MNSGVDAAHRAESASLRLHLAPEDNARLATLCGALDENVLGLAQLVGVDLRRRGFEFELSGSVAAVSLAQACLQSLYAQVDERPLDMATVQLVVTDLSEREAAETRAQIATPRLLVQARGPRQSRYLEQIAGYDLSFGVGPAGTGKTFLAVACAVDALLSDQVQRIVLARPAVEAGERLGFLPGDVSSKVDPYLRPLYDALYEMLGMERVAKLLERQVVEIAPLAFMRGRTLSNAFVILDEAQNTTVEQMKMLLTRLGFGSRLVVTGDTTQVDLPRGQQSGLVHALEVLRSVDEVAVTRFLPADVVRHPLVRRIVSAYENASKAKATRPR